MYYEECDKLSIHEMRDYNEEIIDGKPRYRWYKLALNSVYMISDIDELTEIGHRSFDNLVEWFKACEWVAQNDPEALVHIMRNLIPPVTSIVKQKLLAGLCNLSFYKASDIVKKHLASYPVPAIRTKKRYLEKAEKYIVQNVVTPMRGCCQILDNFKVNSPNKLTRDKDAEYDNALSVILNINFHLQNDKLDTSLMYMEWMRTNTPDKLKELFTFEISIEIKEQLFALLVDAEYFHLRNFLNDVIKDKSSLFYFEIPPYIHSSINFLDDYFGIDDDDD